MTAPNANLVGADADVGTTDPDEATPAIVEFRDVDFRYDSGLLALDGVDLRVEPGRNVAITGPSGCGKSTLLRLAAGLTTPTRGMLARGPVPEGAHPLSMMFQEDTLLPWLTVAGNIALHFKFRRRPKSYVRDLIGELLPLVGLQDFENAYPYQLSIGMRRRVAFLSAIAPRPQLLLLDEPFSALDEPTRVALHQDVLRVTQELGTTLVLVTHDIAEAVSLSDEVLVLSKRPGRVAGRHLMTFGKERDVLGMRESEDFLHLYGEVWSDLRRQIRGEES
ncbi:ABC transporter ATP-binding protein [Pseudonocardia ailaonensis]|uniref:ABC transporter ATP-binding protein n=1 Tax=Pseudonocardia ailaonensis TaxID=367279 RepID=A0ABN2N8V2_9PSEU